MTQTTNWITFKAAKVEYSTNGSAWTDISGFANAVSHDGGERKSGEVYTFDTDVPAPTAGKREPITVKVKVLYTEGAGDIQEIVRAAYETPSDLYFRWSPKGGTTGQFLYTTSKGVVLNAPYPQGEGESADPVFFEVNLKVASITKSLAA